MKYGGDVSGPSLIWPKLCQLTRFGLKTCWKPIFLSFITVKVDLELKNCENVKKFQNALGRSDFTDLFIKKLVYIRFYKLVTSYDLAPGPARYLEGFSRYGSRKVWDVRSRTDFIRPPRPTKFYVVNACGVAVVLTHFGQLSAL